MRRGASPSAADAVSSGAVSSAGRARWSLWSAKSSAHAQRADATRDGVRFDRDGAPAERGHHDVIARCVTFEARDARERAARFVDEAARDREGALAERLLDACAVEVAGREIERALRVGRDRELFELERVDAGVAVRERSELHLRDDLHDERKKLGVGEELARSGVHERVEARGGDEADERRELDGLLGGRWLRRGPARNQRSEADRSDPNDQLHLTTLTQAKRRFFEPTRRR